MARYKPIDTNPRLLPVNLAAQLLPGTFELAVDHLLYGITHSYALTITQFYAPALARCGT